MKLFGNKREIERLNKEIKRLRNEHADRCGEVNELIDNPYSERSIKLKLMRSVDIQIIRSLWYGEVTGTNPNYEGIGAYIAFDPTVAVVTTEP